MSGNGLSLDISLARDRFDVQVKTEITPQGITAIFGPSGAGKSSLLRAIAGLETPQNGQITLAGSTIFDAHTRINTPPHKREIGYVFQDAPLFSHLNVLGNLVFAQKRAPHAVPTDLERAVNAFGLKPFLSQPVHTLSGGERRRVALAQSVLSGPSWLLLDEPLVGLDARSKDDIMRVIKSLSASYDLPILLVTHDMIEVGTLSDHIIQMEHGKIVASGAALSMLPKLQHSLKGQAELKSWFDASLISIDKDYDAQIWQLSAAHQLILPHRGLTQIGERARLSIDASDVSIALHPPKAMSIQNQLSARVKSISPQGPRLAVQLYLPDVDRILPDLYAYITPLAQAKLQLREGQSVTALVKSVSLSA